MIKSYLLKGYQISKHGNVLYSRDEDQVYCTPSPPWSVSLLRDRDWGANRIVI
jgi:hypothetical protein